MSVFKKGELRLLWNFYLYLLFWTFSLMIFPYTFIYFRDIGFSYTQIASFTSVMLLSLFIFEVPTGIVADLYGRKISVAIGLIICGISPIIIASNNSYLLILICYIFIGLGMTFISGAEEALIVDNLKFHNREDLIKEYYIKLSSFIGLGTVVAYLIGAAIVKYIGITPLWYIWGGGYLLSALLLNFIKEHGFRPIKSKKGLISTIFHPVKLSFHQIVTNKTFLNYLIGSSLLTVMFVQRDIWNIFLVDRGISESMLSIIASITSLCIMILPWFSRRVSQIKKALLMTTALRVIILLSVLIVDRERILLGVILFIILGSLEAFESPLTSTYVQSVVKSENRATMGSLMSMIYSLLGAIAGVMIGISSDLIGVKLSIALFSIFGIISLIFYSRMSYIRGREGDDEI